MKAFTQLEVSSFKRKRSRSKLLTGFTLVELMISAFILLLVAGGVFSIMNIVNIDWFSEVGLLNLHQQARNAMHGMVRELRQSKNQNITIAGDGSEIQFLVPKDITAAPNTYYQPIKYYLNTDNQAIREHPLGTAAVLANNIKNINFCFWDGSDCCDALTEDCSWIDVVQIDLEAEQSIRQKVLNFDVTEKVRVRNE